MRVLIVCFVVMFVSTVFSQDSSNNIEYNSYWSSGVFDAVPEQMDNKDNVDRYLASRNYDPWSTPLALNQRNTPMTITVDVARIYGFVQTASKFSIDMQLTMVWNDPHTFYQVVSRSIPPLSLVPNSSIIYPLSPRQLWYPSLWFSQHRKIEKSDDTEAGFNGLLSIDFPQGNKTVVPDIVLWRRIIGEVSCKMDFSKYPFDSNTCIVPIVFLDLETDTVIIPRFLAPSGTIQMNTLTAKISFDSNYTITRSVFDRKTKTVINQKYRGVALKIELKRDTGMYAATQFFPLSLITFLSIFSLWVDIGVAPARVGLAITAFLSLVALSFTFTKDLPETPYLTNTGKYNIICLVFAYWTILVFIVIHNVKTYEGSKPATDTSKPSKPIWKTIDEYTRIFTPVAYIIVIIVFFPVVANQK